jgi:hypothetical protein
MKWSGELFVFSREPQPSAQDQAGDAIVQFYADWGKPAKQTEWTGKLKAGRNTATTPAP